MIPEPDRNPDHLHPIFRAPVENWLAAVRAAGYHVQVIETFRTAERQDWLYEQGRTRPGAQVTRTRDSAHEYGVALDWMPQVWTGTGWLGTWDVTLYNRIYVAVPPKNFGLETLAWERPHLQLAGVNGPDQNLNVGFWAAKAGIEADVVVGSSWPPPPPVMVPIAPVVKAPAGRRVFVANASGNWEDVNGKRVQIGDVVVNAEGADVWIAPGGR